MITATGLTRRFGSRTVVNDVSFDVSRSEIVALLGPNGAGKTTTLRMLAGLIAPSSGAVAIDGVALTRATGTALRSRIGFLTEAPGLWDRLTVRENLRIYAGLHGLLNAERTIDRALEMFELSDRGSERAVELSKGTRQKVALARTLLHDPAILLLDEPTSGLDPEVTRTVRRLLEERRAAGCSILVSTHNLDEAERLADRVGVLQERLLAIDRPSVLRRRLTTGRVIVRVAGDPAAHIDTARAADPEASIEGAALILRFSEPERQTPALVAALVAAGAQILEVRAEIPALEDVYLHLMGDTQGRVGQVGQVGQVGRVGRVGPVGQVGRVGQVGQVGQVGSRGAGGAGGGRSMTMMRIGTLLAKEFLDIARNRAALVPVVIVTAMSLLLPFGIAVGIPMLTGSGLGQDADLVKVSAVTGARGDLSSDARVQLFLFQQFLMMFLLTPITGAMALAAHAIVGEKQARTLEPLLATPITTVELLTAKVFGALLPTLAISLAGLALYVGGITLFAAPGVAAAMMSARTLVLIVLVAPAAALVSLQAAILISSRVNDARTAQQFGVLIIIPLTAILVAQFTGSLWLSATALGVAGLGLLVIWVILTLLSVALFDREAILTRWR